MSYDLIDRAIAFSVRKKKSLEVLHRYIRLKYRIHIDKKILKKRMVMAQNLKLV